MSRCASRGLMSRDAAGKEDKMDLTLKAYELRRDIVEMVYRSGAGHIGGDLSVIDILTALYYREMNVSPKNWKDPDRDRFLLSKGHCADALYVVLGDLGFFDKREVIETFSACGSRYIGHPSMDVPGVEINSGSLGHGLSLGVGMALAAKMDGRPCRIYVVLGDGEMAEGSNYEAMMAAGHYKLDNLCATVDRNGLQISGTTRQVMDSSDLGDKFRSFGWNVIECAEGNDTGSLCHAYELAKKTAGRPSVLIAHTVKGKGIPFMEDRKEWHHGVMTKEQYRTAMCGLEETITRLKRAAEFPEKEAAVR